VAFFALAGATWVASSAVWFVFFRRSVSRMSSRLLFAAVLGLATTFVVWLVLSALLVGRSND